MNAIEEWLQPESPQDGNERLMSRFIARKVEMKYKTSLGVKLEQEYGVTREGQAQPSPIIKPRADWKIWTFIAAACLVCIIGLKIFLHTDSPYELAMSFIDKQEFFHSGTSKGSLDVSFIQEQAQLRFNEKKYGEAVQLFLQIPDPTEEDIYYHALALMLSENPKEAIPLFDSFESKESQYAEGARWYKAITFMLTDQAKEAVVVLRKINPEEWNYKLARTYIRKLE